MTVVRLPDGRAAQLWDGGDPGGVPAVFCHGTPDTRHAAMTGDGAARAAGVRLVAVNRPGYGQSDPAASGHASVADDLVAVADLLGLETFALLGMSIGGQYALACAARHPGRVVAVGAVATPAVVPELDPPWPRDDLDPEQQRFYAELAAATVDEAAERVRPDFEEWVASMAPADGDTAALVRRWLAALPTADAALLAARVPPTAIAASVREALARPDGYLRDAALAFRGWEVRPEGVRCPAYLWYGGRDDNAPARHGRWLAEHVPGARLVVREDETHLALLLRHWPELLTTLRDAV